MKSKSIVFFALLLSVCSCQLMSNSKSGSDVRITLNKEIFSDIVDDKYKGEINENTEAESLITINKDSLIAQLTDENSLLIITDLFLIKFPNTMEYPLKKEADNIIKNYQIDIELFLMYCSDMFETEFMFYPLIENVEITKIEQQFSSTLFFNEDGSGGTWSIEGVNEVSSDWLIVEQLEELIFKTLSKKVLGETKPEIPEKSISVAEEYIKEREITTTYSEYPCANKLKIFWKTAERESEFIINFGILHGD